MKKRLASIALSMALLAGCIVFPAEAVLGESETSVEDAAVETESYIDTAPAEEELVVESEPVTVHASVDAAPANSSLANMQVVAASATAYSINGKTIRYTDFDSSPDECWAYAQKVYKKIWGYNFSTEFSSSDNLLRNLKDSDLTLTADHLKKYVSAAQLGAVLRICNANYLHAGDNLGHSQIIVQKDSNGFTVIQGGLGKIGYPYCNEKYYSWSEYINTSWLGGQYSYIKYIQWPGVSPISSSSTKEDTKTLPTISGQNTPGDLKQGNVFSIKGTISSATKLTNVTVGVFDKESGGSMKTGKSVNPGGTSYNVYNLDNYVEFNKLAAGTYYYRITATNAAGTKTLVNKKFTVKGTDTSIKLSGANSPSSINQGGVFSIKGTISSGVKITSVTVGVFDKQSGGSMKTGKTVSPNSTSYNIHNVDNYVLFNKLAAGTYYYRITATNSSGTKTLMNQKFTVKANTDITLSNANKPSSIKKGGVFSIRGTISSGVKITSVAVGVYDKSSGGSMKTGKTVSPNSTSYNIYNLDNYILFNKLGTGTYYYRITATNAGGTKILMNQKFTVTN